MDEPDDQPRHRKPQKIDMDPMSIEELRDYITALQDEIHRVESEIAKKERHRGSVEGLFKS